VRESSTFSDINNEGVANDEHECSLIVGKRKGKESKFIKGFDL
jgi:hypothetical protein